MAHTFVRDERDGILLERGEDGDDRHALLDRGEAAHARAHDEVRLPGGEQLVNVDLRPARLERDVKPVFLIDPVGLCLERPAVLGLRVPVKGVRDRGELFLLRKSASANRNQSNAGQRDNSFHLASPIMTTF